MPVAHDFESIKKQYLELHSKAIQNNKEAMHFDVEDWRNTLSDIQLKVYKDIKSVGTYLYPLYPIGDYFIDFGNPFKKVGIEILYKEREREERLACIQYFEKLGWTVYTLESKYVENSAEELFSKQMNRPGQNFYSDDNMFEFVEQNKDKSSECLIYYIKQKYITPTFQEDVEEEED